MRALYKMKVDFGRIGEIESLFIAEEKDVETAIGKLVNLGEVLGKHSEVSFILKEEHLEVISKSADLLVALDSCFNNSTLCGYNPLHYLDYLYRDE